MSPRTVSYNGRIVLVSGVSLVALALAAFFLYETLAWRTFEVTVTPSLEERLEDGSYYNPSTQSFLRGKHLFEAVNKAEFKVRRDGPTEVILKLTDGHKFKVVGLDFEQLVPRLHYIPHSPADDFDAYNLMLAEFSRNSLSVPVGKSGDAMAHFETSLQEATPWTLNGDYVFVPNPNIRPVRFGLVNNCLKSGLWEFSGVDRTGEIYHAWFPFPLDEYYSLVARTNHLDVGFVENAMNWRSTKPTMHLDRLRSVMADLGVVKASAMVDQPIGFSSQDSRRKLHKSFVQVARQEEWVAPKSLDDLTSSLSRFSNFVEPGKYSLKERKPFDLRFLGTLKSAVVSRVNAKTSYNQKDSGPRKKEGAHLEIQLLLEKRKIILGNLPVDQLVPQEDFALAGFGVGILSSSGIAERRHYLIHEGPAPSFAYLCEAQGDALVGLNSHEFGIEQIFIRTHINDTTPWWEITITSYERIVDLVKYRVDIPEPLLEELKHATLAYISPLYRTYRDDNLR